MKEKIFGELNQSLTPKNKTRENLKPGKQDLKIANKFQLVIHDAHPDGERDSF